MQLLRPMLGTRTGSWVGETSIYIFDRRQESAPNKLAGEE